MSNNSMYPNGQVILPIETYNELMSEVNSIRRAVSIRKSYSNRIELEIDKSYLIAAGKELFNKSSYVATHTLVADDDYYFSSTTIAAPNPEPPTDEEDPAVDVI